MNSRGSAMTCQQVSTLLALPLGEAPRRRLEAATQHAGACVRCRQALAETSRLEAALTDLPDAEPPAEMAAVVLARVARAAEEREARRTQPYRELAVRRLDLSWAWTLTGLILALGGYVYRLMTGGRLSGPESSLPGIGGSSGPFPVDPVGWLLAAGLLLYLAGLFSGGRRTSVE